MNTIELIRSRRSTRRYKQQEVPEELLETIVEAGRYAPSGSNSQTTHFFVITDTKELQDLRELATKCFSEMEPEEGQYASLAHAIRQSKTGEYNFNYSSPVLIVTANRKDYGNNYADCACALENMMLEANDLDLGSCWINQLRWLNEDPRIIAKFKEYGMQEDERIYGALAVGYPDTDSGLPEREPLPRKGNEVTWIR